MTAPGLSGPVNVVRDEWGVPHIYGQSLPDVAYAQGFMTASDRIVQMELYRHQADGSLSLVVGGLRPAALDDDIRMRVHHLRATANAQLELLRASSDATDQEIVRTLTSYAAGVNAYLAELQAGRAALPAEIAALYNPSNIRPWTEADSLVIGELLSFSLAFNGDAEIDYTRIHDRAEQVYPQNDPRNGIDRDLLLFAPVDRTYTLQGWPGLGQGVRPATSQKTARIAPQAVRTAGQAGSRLTAQDRARRQAVLAAAADNLRGIGNLLTQNIEFGSNDWVVGPSLSSTGNALLANDPHLSLGNPSTFYMVHLVVSGSRPLNVLGAGLVGIPGVVLGFNEHVAWGSTTSVLDVTDVYEETVVPCSGSTNGAQCVVFRGNQVQLTPRQETFEVGLFGEVQSTVQVTLYDVPHHGPIVPRVSSGQVAALGSTELSVRYTGYEPALQLRAILNLDRSASVNQALQALNQDFKYGGQNWVMVDDQKNFGWTQIVRVPRRQAGPPPWLVLPGDGSAEWAGDLDPRYIPQAVNPSQGFLATANADPIGVTDDGDPWNEPVVNGLPLYIGYGWDAGTRVGRITKRIQAGSTGGRKLTLDDMQSIQADAVSEWGETLSPALIAAGQALASEIANPGSNPDLAAIALGARSDVKNLVSFAVGRVTAWSFDTPSGVDEATGAALTSPASVVNDSQATLIFTAWWQRLTALALNDELTQLGAQQPQVDVARLIARMVTQPASLATGESSPGNARLFDDVTTPQVETQRQIAAQALVDTLALLIDRLGGDQTAWRWGTMHTLTLRFPLGLDTLNTPKPSDTPFGNGFPRHGANGTVDVASPGLSVFGNFAYRSGPVQRLVCEMTPNGPRARNTLPGGETFNPASPHYRDLIELWRRNQTFDVAFTEQDVGASAQREYNTRQIGRVRFNPATR
jgi:penicillin amidase